MKELFAAAGEGKRKLLMSAVNWGEIYYSVWRDQGQEEAERAAYYIAQLPIEVVPADIGLAKRAAEFKMKYKLHYADAFAAALARQNDASLAASDRDFSAVKGLIPLISI
jgi:ribonuclease VapC